MKECRMSKAEKIQEPEHEILKIGIKIGILHTIADSVYENTERKIREAVSNSMDNNANFCSVLVDPDNKKLSIFDNGDGITKDRFKEIFKGIGYGISKNEPNSLSYFGIGLMSVFQLGKKITIFTRSAKELKLLKLTVKSDCIFDKTNEKEPLEFIDKLIELVETDENERNNMSPLAIENIQETIKIFPISFTEIIIEDIVDEDFKFLIGNNFENRMRKILPLGIDKKDNFLDNIDIIDINDNNPEKKFKTLLFDNRTFFPTIDFYYGVLGSKQYRQLYKYFPDFKKEFESGVLNVVYGQTEKFAYYVIYAAEDLSDSNQEDNNDVGFWVRNRNFLVKEADYFIRPGTKKKYIQEPLKNWMYAEIFHKNLNNMLMISRNEYKWDSSEFNEFQREIKKISEYINKELRTIYNNKKNIIDSIIIPFVDLRNPSRSALSKIKERLFEMKIKFEAENINNIFDKLKQNRQPSIENESKSIYEIIKRAKNPIILQSNKEVNIIIDPNYNGQEDYTAKWNNKSKLLTVSISPELFRPTKQEVLGKTFDIYLVDAKEEDSGISFNVDEGKIFINLFNKDIINNSVSFLDIYIAAELAESIADNKTEMKGYLLSLLGIKSKNYREYLKPMADELKRIRAGS